LSRFTRLVSRCAVCGRRERLKVRCRAASEFSIKAVLDVGWRDTARFFRNPEITRSTIEKMISASRASDGARQRRSDADRLRIPPKPLKLQPLPRQPCISPANRIPKEDKMRKTIGGRFFATILISCFGAFTLMQASDKNDSNANSELSRATETVQNITTASPDKGVPRDVLNGAKCVAVIPKLIKGAFVVGGEHGKGVATCKTSSGSWSAPAPFEVSGISWGPQIGGKSTDLMMFIMNDEGMGHLMRGRHQDRRRRFRCSRTSWAHCVR